MTYEARYSYEDPLVVESYERTRFAGPLGRRRWAAEQAALARAFDLLPPGSRVLDCPVGNGRWAEQLVRRGHTVTGVDVSASMLAAAGRRPALRPGRAPSLIRSSAENLAVADASFDVVFSHALTKHLPGDVQDQVFAEYARVARSVVVCSFSVLSGLGGTVWRLRRLDDAYGRTPAQLRRLAGRHGLRIRASFSCTTPLGAERTVVFARP